MGQSPPHPSVRQPFPRRNCPTSNSIASVKWFFPDNVSPTSQLVKLTNDDKYSRENSRQINTFYTKIPPIVCHFCLLCLQDCKTCHVDMIYAHRYGLHRSRGKHILEFVWAGSLAFREEAMFFSSAKQISCKCVRGQWAEINFSTGYCEPLLGSLL